MSLQVSTWSLDHFIKKCDGIEEIAHKNTEHVYRPFTVVMRNTQVKLNKAT
jgi:hypothetical protein